MAQEGTKVKTSSSPPPVPEGVYVGGASWSGGATTSYIQYPSGETKPITPKGEVIESTTGYIYPLQGGTQVEPVKKELTTTKTEIGQKTQTLPTQKITITKTTTQPETIGLGLYQTAINRIETSPEFSKRGPIEDIAKGTLKTAVSPVAFIDIAAQGVLRPNRFIQQASDFPQGLIEGPIYMAKSAVQNPYEFAGGLALGYAFGGAVRASQLQRANAPVKVTQASTFLIEKKTGFDKGVATSGQVETVLMTKVPKFFGEETVYTRYSGKGFALSFEKPLNTPQGPISGTGAFFGLEKGTLNPVQAVSLSKPTFTFVGQQSGVVEINPSAQQSFSGFSAKSFTKTASQQLGPEVKGNLGSETLYREFTKGLTSSGKKFSIFGITKVIDTTTSKAPSMGISTGLSDVGGGTTQLFSLKSFSVVPKNLDVQFQKVSAAQVSLRQQANVFSTSSTVLGISGKSMQFQAPQQKPNVVLKQATYLPRGIVERQKTFELSKGSEKIVSSNIISITKSKTQFVSRTSVFDNTAQIIRPRTASVEKTDVGQVSEQIVKQAELAKTVSKTTFATTVFPKPPSIIKEETVFPFYARQAPSNDVMPRFKAMKFRIPKSFKQYRPSILGIKLNLRTPKLKKRRLTGFEIRGL